MGRGCFGGGAAAAAAAASNTIRCPSCGAQCTAHLWRKMAARVPGSLREAGEAKLPQDTPHRGPCSGGPGGSFPSVDLTQGRGRSEGWYWGGSLLWST